MRKTRKRKTKSAPAKRPVKRKAKSQSGPRALRWWHVLLGLLVVFTGYCVYLDYVVRDQFEAKRWALPAQVYASPLELYAGLAMRPDDLQREMKMLHYQHTASPATPGSFQRDGNQYDIVTRAFTFWDSREPSRHIFVRFDGDKVTSIRNSENQDVSLVRFDPVHIGGIYPARKEDRILVQLKDVPTALPKVLIGVEDRKFYSHHGVDPRAMVRALLADIRAGATVQGGSTLTQQLVKNFFLSNKRTLWRKFNEVIMAVLLEMHYSKHEILESYINEVYLGQDGALAIHGFGLASKFYFNKPISELNLNQICTLVAMIRGPSYYNPVKHMPRLLARRNRILDMLVSQNIINQHKANSVKSQPIRVVPVRHVATSSHPAFMELVHGQLLKYYQHKDLTTEGLRIFTTLNPLIQRDMEKSVRLRTAQLDRARHLHGKLQAAAIVASVTSGEIKALVGGADPLFAGYNRALDASRQIGSLIKPVIYLSALEQKDKYNWLTPIDDSRITLKGRGNSVWSPRNYDRESHGVVPLVTALSHSYNQATVRLGMQVGFPAINDTLHRLGIQRDIPAYPAMLLGSSVMTPMEVLQMYQTMAADGFRSPLRAIREVLGPDGQPLRHYPIQVQQAFNSNLIQVLDSGLVQVVEQGTAHSLRQRLAPGVEVAGKTGTTDDTRDSWFAGFDASHVAVVWMGTDDNAPTGLTGSSGALLLWGDIFTRMLPKSLSFESSEGLEVHWVDLKSRSLTDAQCPGAVQLAFLPGAAPTETINCSTGIRSRINNTVNWFKRLFR
ncbi:MAG: penicillin-binding protein 1B [Gammaproteobacteria bacterium]